MAGENAARRPVGVVLAGGESRRLGRDKATLEVGGRSLVARAADHLARVCAEVVVADRGRGLLAGLASLPDGPGRGPAAGMLGAAAARPDRALLVLACDLPHVPDGLLAGLARSRRYDLVLPRGSGGLEPLCALYRPRALAVLASRVGAGRFALHPLARHPALAVLALGLEDAAPWGPPEEAFANLNRPEDLERFLQAAGSPLPAGSPPPGGPPPGSISRRKS